MLNRLIESAARRPERPRTLPGAMLSVALHAGAILSLVYLTRPGAPPLPPIALDSALVFPRPPSPDRDRGVDRPVGRLPDIEPGPVVSDLDVLVTVPDGIPPVDLGGPAWRIPGRPAPGSIFDALGAGEPGEPFAPAAIDEPPVRRFSPPIEYPPRLARAGIEGIVVLEAVVDTLGMVERGTVRVLSADHPGLEASARRVVERSRFRPGRVRGRPVRVVVRLPVEFRLR